MVKLQDNLGDKAPANKFFASNEIGGYLLGTNFGRNSVEDTYGFRLQELNHSSDLCGNKEICDETVTSISGHSTYKQRIDSMFDDSRSLVSERSKEYYKMKKDSSISNLIDEYQVENDKCVKNNIQEKIEKMFEEISLNGFRRNNSFKNLQSHKNSERNEGVVRDFKVIYLGSKALADKSVSLITLQEPLKDLYLDHKRKNISGFNNRLIISREGLKIKIHDNVTLNPFPTIAVWASVKFTLRLTKSGKEYAFIPLIKDPDGIDKNMLFRKIKDDEKILLSDNNNETSSQPIFSVVMKNNKDKSLECHAFICLSSEDAIIVAANLYQALMKKMKRKNIMKTSDFSSSEATPIESEPEKMEPIRETKFLPKSSPPPVPSRPSRKNSREKIESKFVVETKEPVDEVPNVDTKSQPRRGSVPNNMFTVNTEPVSTLRRSVSERRNNCADRLEGDILTKVAIPRSRSFLNANGPLTRYSRRYEMAAHSDGEVTSPLGFNELFNEFRQNEGLESMDDILNAIIDAEGMSFNDLKPIYKEFLLKLAVTLTKDELFQRSKNIMRRQKKKSRSRSSRKKAFVSATGIRKVFRKTASKLSKQKNSRPTTLEFTSVVFQRSGKHFETSTSSNCSSEAKKKEIRRRQSCKRRTKKPNKKVSSTSEDSDFFLRRNGNESGGFPNRSSSGYFSCSECSYDSENCTCTSADKCYCTLGKKDKDKMSVSSCGRDTESCVDSEKCYCSGMNVINLADMKGVCQTPHLHQNKVHNTNCPNYVKTEKNCKKHSPTIFEQLKEQGFAASDSSLSRAASPSTAWRNNEERVARPKECLKASKSLEFLQIRPQKPVNRQQMNECPPPPILPEPSTRQSNFVEGTRHFCYHGQEVSSSSDKRKQTVSAFKPRRQYSSMRSRTLVVDNATTRLRNRAFSSMRAKSYHDDIMNRVLFPDRGGSTTSSLRFARRIDVYSSFQSRRCVERQGSYIDLLNQIRTRFENPYHHRHQRKECLQTGFNRIQERPPCPHETSQLYFSSGGSDNFQKLDYDLFSSSTKSSEASEVPSNGSERKVLVVSARDPKGKVLYMGASSRGENVRNIINDRNAASASEALSVKKSAEIAALFSDVYGKQKLNRGQSVKDVRVQSRSSTSRLSNMENTLGYLP